MENLVLYSYFRSSASYRVRAALNLKKLPYTTKAVNLKTAEHLLPDFNKISSFSELPVLSHNGNEIAQSMAIITYLEDTFTDTYKLFPKLSYDKAIVIQMCEVINSGIHPLQNLSVGKKLKSEHGLSIDDAIAWNVFWINKGFTSFEKLLANFHGDFCFGNEITAADLFLVPQVYNAKRYKVDMAKFPIISQINNNCLNNSDIKNASPGFQSDTPENLKGHL